LSIANSLPQFLRVEKLHFCFKSYPQPADEAVVLFYLSQKEKWRKVLTSVLRWCKMELGGEKWGN